MDLEEGGDEAVDRHRRARHEHPACTSGAHAVRPHPALRRARHHARGRAGLGVEDDVAERLKRGEAVEGGPGHWSEVQPRRDPARARASWTRSAPRSSSTRPRRRGRGSTACWSRGRLEAAGLPRAAPGAHPRRRSSAARSSVAPSHSSSLSEEALAEAEPLLAVAVGLGDPGEAPVSQVNLLPPEILAPAEDARLHHHDRRGAGAVVLALLIAFCFLQSQQLAGVNDDIAAQNATNAELQQRRSTTSPSSQALQAEAGEPSSLLVCGVAGRGLVLADADGHVARDPVRHGRSAPLAFQLDAGATTVGTSTTPGTTGTTSFAGAITVDGRRGRVRQPRDMADAPRIGQGVGEPLGVDGAHGDDGALGSVRLQHRRGPLERAVTARGSQAAPVGDRRASDHRGESRSPWRSCWSCSSWSCRRWGR